MTGANRRSPAFSIALFVVFLLLVAGSIWAARLIRSNANSNEAKARSLMKMAKQAYAEGRVQPALDYLAEVPDKPTLLAFSAKFSAGTILVETHRWREAESMFRQALQIASNSPEPHANLAYMYVRKLMGKEARAELEAVRRFRPWTTEQLALYITAGQITNPVLEHIATLKKVLAVDPEDADARIALARYYLFRGEPRNAISELKGIRLSDRAAAVLAEAYLADGNLKEAKSLLAPRASGSNTSAELLRAFGWLVFEEGDWTAALRLLRRAVAMDENDLPTLHRLEVALRKSGETGPADNLKLHFQKLERLPGMTFALQASEGKPSEVAMHGENLADLLSELGRTTDAIYCLEHCEGFAPSVAIKSRLAQKRARLEGQKGQGSGDGDQPIRVDPRQIAEQTDGTTFEEKTDAVSITFTDVAKQAGINFQYFNGRSKRHEVAETLGGGIAPFDFDLDGRVDLFFAQGNDIPAGGDHAYSNELYRQSIHGAFERATELAGLKESQYSLGCTAGDFDNDGFVDLFVTNLGPCHLHRNNGDGTFAQPTAVGPFDATGTYSSALWSDLDLDGDLDLFVARYVDQSKYCKNANGEYVVCHPKELASTHSLLFENQGDGSFKNISQSAGIEVPNGKGLGAVAIDSEGDGRPDIYVSNDTTPNFLFLNQPKSPGIRFIEDGWSAGVAVSGAGDSQAGMGIACADFDRNGLQDLFVTNFYAETNVLYLNQGKRFFVDSTNKYRMSAPSRMMLGFGSVAIDADLDGWQDLAVTNGHIYDNRHLGEPLEMRSQLFRNRGKNFEELSFASDNYFSREVLGRGMSLLDWNRDGKPDLVITHLDQPAALVENRSKEAGNWLAVDLVGTHSNRDGLNAKITLRAGETTWSFENFNGGYLSSNENRLIIGLGKLTSIPVLEVTWQSGAKTRLENVAVNQLHLIREVSPTGVQ